MIQFPTKSNASPLIRSLFLLQSAILWYFDSVVGRMVTVFTKLLNEAPTFKENQKLAEYREPFNSTWGARHKPMVSGAVGQHK
jgi:hypothetical protein